MRSRCTFVWLWRAIAIGAALNVASSVARAHDSPRVRDILLGADSKTVMVANRGLIFGERDSATYRLLCNDALGINTSEEANAALMPDGALIISTSAGVFRTTDEGCTLESVAPFEGVNCPALAHDPVDPTKLYVATFGPAVGGIHVSSDSGRNFTLVHPATDEEFYREILIAPSDPDVIYAGGLLFGATTSSHFVERSLDGAGTFERFEISLDENESALTLLAVSPDDDRMLLARALDNDIATRMDRLLVSHDGGETFESPIRLREISDAGFGEGSVWISAATGIFRSDDGAITFEPVEGTQLMSCVGEDEDEVLLCGRYTEGENGIATFDSDSARLHSWFDFTDVTSAVSCDPESQTALTCETLWRDWTREILDVPDASVSDASIDADASDMSPDAGMPEADGGVTGGSHAPRRSNGCSATTIGPHASSGSAPLAFVLAGLVLCRRLPRRPRSKA